MKTTDETLTLSRSVVDSMPVYYRVLADHLADTGRAKIITNTPAPQQVRP